MTARTLKIIVEQHLDGCIAYQAGLKGCVIGQGDNPEMALLDVLSALQFHIETFGLEIRDDVS